MSEKEIPVFQKTAAWEKILFLENGGFFFFSFLSFSRKTSGLFSAVHTYTIVNITIFNNENRTSTIQD